MRADDCDLAAIYNDLAIKDGQTLAQTQEWWNNVGCLVPDSAALVVYAGCAAIKSRLYGYRQVVADACAPWFEARQ